MHKEFSVAIPDEVNITLCDHLIRDDYEEDLCFALWTPSEGKIRLTALLHSPVLPIEGDRQRHGNVSFNQQYFERVCHLAMQENCGVAFLHSHPGPGWQGMSSDDIAAELKIAGSTMGLTDLQLVGLTVGHDGTWSGRFWEHKNDKEYDRKWCHSVRVIGTKLDISFNDNLIPKPVFRELFKRTVTVWGEENHTRLARLRIGIVGLGSVGSNVAENLARMGFQKFVLLDFDEIQTHNLDRLIGATIDDIGKLKIDVAEREIHKSATADDLEIQKVPFSIAEKEGYQAALDCDVLFSCVDRPRPRHILNHFAYSHLIPVIDGGIAVRFRNEEFSGVDWQLQTVGPTRPCLACIGAFNVADVSTEIEGKLDDPSYLQGLSKDHHFKRNENVFPFSANLASLEVLQLIALVTGIAGITDFGIQRFRYNPGIMDNDTEKVCKEGCEFKKLIGQGDRYFTLVGQDFGAENARERQEISLEEVKI